MNRTTQNQTIIKLLQDHPEGINRMWVTQNYQIVDVPTRISDVKPYFRAKGILVDKRREKNGTATYFLSNLSSTPIVEPSYVYETYIDDEGRPMARQVEVKPVQESFI